MPIRYGFELTTANVADIGSIKAGDDKFGIPAPPTTCMTGGVLFVADLPLGILPDIAYQNFMVETRCTSVIKKNVIKNNNNAIGTLRLAE